MKRNCKIREGKNGKYKCVIHDQALLYVYDLNGTIGYRCQVGEDLRPPSKIQIKLWEEGSEK